MKDILVSIVTPCFNARAFLENYFCCLLNQTYKNYEIILVDDGSTDGSETIVKNYKDIFNDRLIYIKQKHKGSSSALNAGLKMVRGKYMTWFDVDDRMHADYIEKKLGKR